MQQPSPTLSSPSTGFLGPRSSPLFSAVDQTDSVPATGQDVIRSTLLTSGKENDQAPPKRLANALEGLGRAIRHIADIRSGADLLLEALEAAALIGGRETGNKKASDGIQKAADTIGKALEELSATGKELEAAGVLNGAQQRFEDDGLWHLQVPFVCPDGALVPYAWKRQIAGQAAASAYDRARLALKAFDGQKRRFFPGLVPALSSETVHNINSKRLRTDGSESPETSTPLLTNIVRELQTETPGMFVTPYKRLAWASKATSRSDLSSSSVCNTLSANSSLSLTNGTAGIPTPAGVDISPSSARPAENMAVLEVSIPGVLMALVSVLPAGSVYPDAIAVFSPDEKGGHIQAWGVSQHKLYQQLSGQAISVLHECLKDRSSALETLLKWLYSYRTLFTKPCSECKRLMAFDAPSDLMFPPLIRPTQLPAAKQHAKRVKNDKPETSIAEIEVLAYHLGCMPKDL